MGRMKLNIVKQAKNKLLSTYNKRKSGVSKKARELAILCDTDVLLLTVSPKGNHDLTLGPNSNFEEVIRRYGNVNPVEREKRRHESVKTLCKAYKDANDDHKVNAEELLKHGAPKTAHTYKISAEEMQLIESKLGKLKHIEEIHMINNIGLLNDMEMEIYRLIDQTEGLVKDHQLRESNAQTFSLQEVNDPTPLNFFEDPMPLNYVPQISREEDTTDPSLTSSSMLPAPIMNEDSTTDYLNLNSDNDAMKGSQEFDWWVRHYD